MGDERSIGLGIGAGAAWPSRRAVDSATLQSLLAGGAQRARLLLSGGAGPLNDRQRLLTTDLLRDLERLCEATGAAMGPPGDPEVFDIGAAAADVVGALRFMAHRKQLALTLTGAGGRCEGVAVHDVVHSALLDIIGAAVAAAPGGSRVAVELARSADRIAVDVSAPGWEPHLPPPPPPGSGVALSVLRTASGARLVLSVPAAL